MPHWGRPPGAKGSKRRKQWEQEQSLYGQRVVVEVDSEDSQGVSLASGTQFVSDPLHFTGTDLATTRSRKNYSFPTEGSFESSSDSEELDMNATQSALRDKEEALVQSALARIRRAQEKGKTEVKLNPEELEALEKRRKMMQAAAMTKARKHSGSSASESDKRRNSRTISVPIAAPVIADQSRPSSRKRGKSTSRAHDEPSPHALSSGGAPGMLIQGPDGVTYAPLGYYPPQAGSHRNSPTRPRSASTQQRGLPSIYAPGGRYFSDSTSPAIGHGPNRHFSDGTRPPSASSISSKRTLPDDRDWVPTSSRRNSVAQSPIDPFDYQLDSDASANSQQYLPAQSHRGFSGPAEIAYSNVRRNLPSGYPAAARVHSDPSVRRKSSRRDVGDDSYEDDDDESEDSDMESGALVEPEPQKAKPVARKAAVAKKKGKK